MMILSPIKVGLHSHFPLDPTSTPGKFSASVILQCLFTQDPQNLTYAYIL